MFSDAIFFMVLKQKFFNIKIYFNLYSVYKSTTLFWPKNLGWKVDLYNWKYGSLYIFADVWNMSHVGWVQYSYKPKHVHMSFGPDQY